MAYVCLVSVIMIIIIIIFSAECVTDFMFAFIQWQEFLFFSFTRIQGHCSALLPILASGPQSIFPIDHDYKRVICKTVLTTGHLELKTRSIITISSLIFTHFFQNPDKRKKNLSHHYNAKLMGWARTHRWARQAIIIGLHRCHLWIQNLVIW